MMDVTAQPQGATMFEPLMQAFVGLVAISALQRDNMTTNNVAHTVIELKRTVDDVRREVVMIRGDLRNLLDKLDATTKETDWEEYDVREMPTVEIKKLILDEKAGGKPFYPSDFAQDHNLHYDAVMEAVEELRKEGHVKE